MTRSDGRGADDLRPTGFATDFQANAMASALVSMGRTRILCAASVVPTVPRWMKEQGVPGGWLTAEYRMLPASTGTRSPRDGTQGRTDSRSREIQRLIGRSLRAAVNLEELGARTVYVDCDVIDADGGTRCASINGAMVAVELALKRLFLAGELRGAPPLLERVAAVSVGLVDGEPLLDLCYTEDVTAAVDCNVIMTATGKCVEVQATAESGTFTTGQMHEMLDLAARGVEQILPLQVAAVRAAMPQPVSG